jgi:uncharacterized protein
MKKILFISALILGTFISKHSNSQNITAVVEDKTKKIEVTGSAEMQIVPDEIFVDFTLQEYYNKQKSKIDIDQIQRDFLDRCNEAGISKDRIKIRSKQLVLEKKKKGTTGPYGFNYLCN